MSQNCCCKLPDWADGQVETPIGKIIRAKTLLSADDKKGVLKCRLNDHFRSNYQIKPGLYAIGNPCAESPILVTANYKLSFDHVRSSIQSLDAWILVLNTKGINVWCAAGKGTFGTKELINRIQTERIDKIISHKQIILPQLGAPGVSAHEVKKATGFSITYGPVKASDIPVFLQNNLVATPKMRTVTFTTIERVVLIPMELFPATKKALLILGIIAVVMGLSPVGISFVHALTLTAPIAIALLAAVITGSVLHPLLLPVFPVRAFSLQGALLGIVAALPFLLYPSFDIYLKIALVIGIPAISSYLALNFTGCTTFTNKSGVKKELTVAWPLSRIVTVLVTSALFAHKLHSEGIIP